MPGSWAWPEFVELQVADRGLRLAPDLSAGLTDAATEGQVMGPGTVIGTSGGHDFKRIFHAGFHDPDDWPGSSISAPHTDDIAQSREFRETGYFSAIGSCVAQILDDAVAQNLKSVAFPMIGCGLFGLDEKMLILQFLDSIEEFDDRLAEGKTLQVWLVIRDRVQSPEEKKVIWMRWRSRCAILGQRSTIGQSFQQW